MAYSRRKWEAPEPLGALGRRDKAVTASAYMGCLTLPSGGASHWLVSCKMIWVALEMVIRIGRAFPVCGLPPACLTCHPQAAGLRGTGAPPHRRFTSLTRQIFLFDCSRFQGPKRVNQELALSAVCDTWLLPVLIRQYSSRGVFNRPE